MQIWFCFLSGVSIKVLQTIKSCKTNYSMTNKSYSTITTTMLETNVIISLLVRQISDIGLSNWALEVTFQTEQCVSAYREKSKIYRSHLYLSPHFIWHIY